MRTVKISTLISNSFERMVEILFKPFSVKKWLKLLLIAFLAGALSGGNGGGGGNSNPPAKKQEVRTATSQDSSGASAANAVSAQGPAAQGAAQSAATSNKTTSEPARKAPPLAFIAIIIGIILSLLLGIIILMTWIGSRFRFVWFNAVVNNSTDMLEPYYRHRVEANSLFRFSMAVFVLFVLFIVAEIAWILYKLFKYGAFNQGFVWSVPAGLDIFLLPVMLLILVLVILIVLTVIIEIFGVPMMALDGSSLGSALKKFRNIFASNWRDVLLFLLILILLGIVAGAAQMALIIGALLAVVLVGLVILGIPLIIMGMLKAKIIFLIYAIVAGTPFLIIAIIVLIATTLPFAVFFRLLSINYLVSLDCGYTQASLAAYSARKAERVSGKAPIIMIVALFMIGFVFFAGLLAAIAIPNFIKAREDALKKKNAAVTYVIGHSRRVV